MKYLHLAWRKRLFCLLLILNSCLSWGWIVGSEAEILGGPANQLERAKEFCGQGGPYLAIGLRMGERALKRLGAEKYTGMTIQVECIPKAPYCLLVDGLQLSTGCTFGNRNIEFASSSGIRVTFTNAQTKERVTYVLADGLRSMIEDWSRTWKSDETVAILLYAVPSESLLFKEMK